jgi:signal transduction histidine kinase
MAPERIDLRSFLSDTLELIGSAIPDDTIFSCRFDETPDVHADREQLRAVLAELLTSACVAPGEVRLRIGTVAGKSGPHAFIEVGQPETRTRIVVPLPVFRPSETRLAGTEPATSRS